MRVRGSVAAVVAVIAVTSIGAGCGSGGGSGKTVTTSQIAKPAYIEKAEAICTENYDRVKIGYEDFVEGKNPKTAFDTLAAQTEYVDSVIVPEKKKTVEEFRALGAPSGDEQSIEELLEAYEEGIEVAEEDSEAAMSWSGVFAYATQVAEKYGLKTCRY